MTEGGCFTAVAHLAICCSILSYNNSELYRYNCPFSKARHFTIQRNLLQDKMSGAPHKHPNSSFWVNRRNIDKHQKPVRQAVKSIREETMGEETTSLGGIHISPNAVATIAYHATLGIVRRGGTCTKEPGRWHCIHALRASLCAAYRSVTTARILILISISLWSMAHASTRWRRAWRTQCVSMWKKRLGCKSIPSMCMWRDYASAILD